MKMTIQEKIKQRLEQFGIPHREIKVYGSQITVEIFGREAAEKFASVIANFAKVRGVIETTVDAKENRGSVMNPTKIRVYRLYARI